MNRVKDVHMEIAAMTRAGVLKSFYTLLIVAAIGCRQSPAPEASGSAAVSINPDENRTLVFATRYEPVYIAKRGLQASAPGSTGPGLFDAGLTQIAGQGLPTELQLAEAFPQLGTETWQVFPDGRMETRWRLRPNLVWHDETPLTAEDFVFGFEVYRVPEFDGARLGGGFIERVSALDARTVVIHWKSPFPDAADDNGTVPALPRHILATPFEQLDSDAFAQHPYWKGAFVGLGAYKLDRWEPGAFIDGTAFTHYALGKPRIERLKLVWISDVNALVANVLSGSLQYVDHLLLEFEQALVLKRQWVALGEGRLAYHPANIRYVQIQYKPEHARPAALQDVRVRRALAHAIDKQALVDAMVDGEPAQADTFLSPHVSYFADLEKVLTKYPFDLRRAHELLAEAGLVQESAGYYVHSGERFAPELAAAAGQGEREALIIQDSWKRIGVEPPLRTISAAQQRDLELVSTYPAFRIDFNNAPNAGVYYATSGCARAERAWVGSNRGCFSDPEYDRLWSIYQTALDKNERANAHVQAMRLLSEKAAGYPLYYAYFINAFASTLVGPTYYYNP